MTKKPSRTQLFSSIVSSMADDLEQGSKTPSPAPAGGAAQRVGSGVISATKDTVISELREERDRLKTELDSAAATGVSTLDPALIDPSPFPDRLVDSGAEEAFELLKQSIAAEGQQIPVLVRPSADNEGRYQVAYGHRRLRAVQELGDRPVRAIIRDLTDAELVQAQGLENSARENLSYIERVLFAAHVRALTDDPAEEVARVKLALSVTDAEASYMKRIKTGINEKLILAIGPAPKIGRPRWMKLVSLVEEEDAEKSALAYIRSAGFGQIDGSDQRFLAVLDHLTARAARDEARSGSPESDTQETTEITIDGQMVGLLKKSGRKALLTLENKEFADYLADQIPALLARFEAEQ
ncbi:plasmid partitioning protein RepB [Coralliovum pocilloporae]|uniref:plasmid partitioning protein RepB n=1 Tax=Coralliovum pocilloporae TaxID=3066369 RepID=UPI003306CF04